MMPRKSRTSESDFAKRAAGAGFSARASWRSECRCGALKYTPVTESLASHKSPNAGEVGIAVNRSQRILYRFLEL